MRGKVVISGLQRQVALSGTEMKTAEKKLRLQYRVLRIVSGTVMLSGLLYQATGTLVSFFGRPTVVDVLIESTQTLRFPGISVCVTNWIKKDKLCQRYPKFCNLTDDKIPELRSVLDQDGNLGEIALDATDVIQTTIEDPTLYYYKFILEDKQIVQSFSRLPKYMCYTLNWKGNQEMSAYHEYPPLFGRMFITWKISRLVSLDRYVADVGFHHVDSLDAGAKHTVILEPNGNYEYSIEQKGSVALPAPYDTNCADYKLLGTHRFYPAYMTQTGNHLRHHSGLPEQREWNTLQRSTTVLAVIGGYLGFWLGLSMYSGVTKILFRIQAIIAKRTKDPLNKARSVTTTTHYIRRLSTYFTPGVALAAVNLSLDPEREPWLASSIKQL
ncbi:hypothetical protein HPB51_019683 [Rhipicephalus microplus]|uniref:Uncharacterized protein n=1 Tax=Rhipicephalus microplus TaxID=6941 RepID=A0A9J6F551_RHIMP|nr:hypothetical protein HPB51_019683 [Rhipicephalus microplus]